MRMPLFALALGVVMACGGSSASSSPDASDSGVADDGGGTSDGAMDDGGLEISCIDSFVPVESPASTPPFAGTAFITDDLITDSDPTSFVDMTYTGQGQRTMFDRRVADFIDVNAHLFEAQFGSSKLVEIQVNPEFTQTEADFEASRYAEVIGRLPAFLFADLETVWIHKGDQPFGGGNNNLLIHTGQGETYLAGGELEEILVHEAAHTSMDGVHASNAMWLEAAAADGVAISTYARDNPNREDVAESLGPYLAARFRASRVDTETLESIEATIPNRLVYLDCLELSMDVLQ